MNTMKNASPEMQVLVLKWTYQLCRALEQQYRDYSLRSTMNSQAMADKPDKYLQDRVVKIENEEDDRISSLLIKVENTTKFV